MTWNQLPPAQGLYDPGREHDACGMGIITHIKGRRSHHLVRQALEILVNLDHRGARGCEPCTGDGAGILLQLPHTFFAGERALPEPGDYGVGAVFLPRAAEPQARLRELIETIAGEEELPFLGWREVPVGASDLGETARRGEPSVQQFFIGSPVAIREAVRKGDLLAFERKLYVLRRRIENAVRSGDYGSCYICSLSSRTVVYKGMLTPQQVGEYYLDLQHEQVDTALALVHSRFSTNTFPSWDRAHPYRYLIHNGEINTLRGNINWMRARQAQASSRLFGDDLPKIFPVVDEESSDSGMFDNVLEFLYLGGRSLPHAVMMMVPEPYDNNPTMSPGRKAFYEYHGCLMEPWDGPASIGFTDGIQVGAVLDRNGLRPSRYYLTSDDLAIVASEVGVLDIPPQTIIGKGRLQPGRMFLVDTGEGRIIVDEEIKENLAAEQPYRQWLTEHMVTLDDLPSGAPAVGPVHETMVQRQLAFGYTWEELTMILLPMARDGVQPIGSMGNDAPLAVLSAQPQLLYNYFKQLFAQVTNPPLDSIREAIVTATETSVGTELNLLEPEPASCRQIAMHSPLLSNEDLEKLRSIGRPGFKAVTLPMLFPARGGAEDLRQALHKLCERASSTLAAGANIIILSDRGVGTRRAPIPALLACAAVHHHLVREGTRTRIGLVVESGEPREVHHYSLLIGYGASAVNPYLAFESLDDLIRQGHLVGMSHDQAVRCYQKAALKGVLKTMAKMGISTIQSYHGAQIFEAVGIATAVVEKYFTGTTSRVGGIGLEEIAASVRQRHERAFPPHGLEVDKSLDPGGLLQWRRGGEYHAYHPVTVHKLQQACRSNNYQLFKEYTALLNERETHLRSLRGLLKLRPRGASIPLEEVEPVESIVRRFKTGAMSYGSISQEAHEALAIAMNRLGGKSNTGEGGEDPARYASGPNGDSRNSAIKQVASGRFGVTSNYLVHGREIQIKMAQGAKPGEGGELPGHKVYPWIAKVRGATPGVGLISPPPHHDIYSIEDLAELIHDLKNANPRADVSVKLVSEVGVGTVAAGVAKAKADGILISGYEGGTGASPQSSIWHAGLPWELGLAEAHQTLLLNKLRSRVRLETDGKLMTGRDVALACLLGAEEFGFATGPLVVLGCIMMRVCHLDTCPVGVATQNPELRKLFTGDPAHVVNFMCFIAREMREVMAELGFATVDEMVGRVDCLEIDEAVAPAQARGLDLSPLLYRPPAAEDSNHCTERQNHGLEQSLDSRELVPRCAPALERGEPVEFALPIRNINRVTGTLLGSEVTRRYGAAGLPEDTIRIKFEGSAGQSFGAFLPRGLTLTLEGDANDYVGKGLSGGRLIITPPPDAAFTPEDNLIIGNVALYGATGGEAFINGIAGERFAVRNSGATAVVEAVGDHGCEYMTGGTVVILGKTGRNFAAGMSGGLAYVLDERRRMQVRCNLEMVDVLPVDEVDEVLALHAIIERHYRLTGSGVGERVLRDWDAYLHYFVKIYPRDYRRALEARRRVEAQGLSGEDAIMAAFEENKKDPARVGGN